MRARTQVPKNSQTMDRKSWQKLRQQVKAHNRDGEPTTLAPSETCTTSRLPYKRAPDELSIAVNGVDNTRMQTASATWLNQRREYRQDAESIGEVPNEYREIKRDPATHAASALSDLRFHRLEIEVSAGRIIARYENRKLSGQHVYETIRAAQRGLDQQGVTAALKALTWNPTRVLKEAGAALERGD